MGTSQLPSKNSTFGLKFAGAAEGATHPGGAMACAKESRVERYTRLHTDRTRSVAILEPFRDEMCSLLAFDWLF